MSPASAGTLTEEVGVARWWVYVLLGVVSLAVGILALTHPKDTLLFLGLLFGITVMFWGAGYLATAFESGASPASSVLHVFLGFFGLVAGLFAIVHPGESVLVLLLAIGFWFILSGAAEIAHAVGHPEHRLLFALLGLVGIAAGVIIIADPDIGLRTLALLAGLGFIVRGVVATALGLALRNA